MGVGSSYPRAVSAERILGSRPSEENAGDGLVVMGALCRVSASYPLSPRRAAKQRAKRRGEVQGEGEPPAATTCPPLLPPTGILLWN